MKHLRGYLLEASEPVQKLAQLITKPEIKMQSSVYHRLREIAMPGDVLISAETWHLTNYFIPGYWAHAALISDRKSTYGDYYVTEAIRGGVCETDLCKFVMTKDSVALLRPLFANSEQRRRAGEISRSFIGDGYDYKFEIAKHRSARGIKKFYCSELPFVCYQNAMKRDSPWKLQKTYGVLTCTPQDYDNAKDKWHSLLDYRGF